EGVFYSYPIQEIGAEHIAPHLTTSTEAGQIIFPKVLPTLEETDRQLTVETLKRTRGNKKKAAKLLGYSRAALYIRIKKFNLLPIIASLRGKRNEIS
ncbi:helix-turn-helix domain-containing protein, partial [Candidatus Parcubacteria bacterium]|nr:helix-turn-helix domain-containing protein [Candidatus Parcubacteria bacterium]